IAELLKDAQAIFLEVGPGQTLSTLTKQQASEQVVLSSLRHPKDEQSDVAFVLNTLGKLWLAGVRMDWSGFYAYEKRDLLKAAALRYRIPLPTYPFERQRYWVDPPKSTTERRTFQTFLTAPELWKSLVKAGQIQASTGIPEFNEPAYLENKQELERLCTAYMNLTLRRLGAFNNPFEKYSLEELLDHCQIVPRYRQLLYRWLQVLVDRGCLQQEEGLFTNLVPLSIESVNALVEEVKIRWADTPRFLDLVQQCGENLATVLTGEKEPLEFFSSLLSEDVETLNLEFPWIAYYSTIMRASLEQVVKSWPSSVNLRIIEIGAGTGYATTTLLPVLPFNQTNYTFTDVGGWFLSQAQKKFADYPFIEYRLLDIEKPPQDQGYERHSFDVVVAANVLHVTRNLEETLEHVRSLLAPGGLLLLWEITQPQLDFDITWSLLMNPLEDEFRSRGNPFSSKEQWYEALRNHGFVEMEAFGETEAFGQHVFVAQASLSTAKKAPPVFTTWDEQKNTDNRSQVSLGKKPDIAEWFYIPSWKRFMPPKPLQLGSQVALPRCWLVFVDECGLGTQIVRRLELEGQDVITVRVGERFSSESESTTENLGQGIYTINPRQGDDYNTLLKELLAHNKLPSKIVHLWSVTPHTHTESGVEGVDKAQYLGFYSLLYITQALGKQNLTDEFQITVVSNNLQAVTGEEML
ncbi:MAG: methyltransferase, partial [Coleofasciculus sp. Co-bin14]|nr:methyltransferase [Coleofasciculus sp. Co-bin14]